MPGLCSIPEQLTSLGRPSSSCFVTMNKEMPRVPAGAPSLRARTRLMILSLQSCSPQLVKILLPEIRKLPSVCSTAYGVTSEARKRVVEGKSVDVRVDPACRPSLKHTNTKP